MKWLSISYYFKYVPVIQEPFYNTKSVGYFNEEKESKLLVLYNFLTYV